jgi:signal transduction histidine kinase
MKQKIIKNIVVCLFLLIQLSGGQLYASNSQINLSGIEESSINLTEYIEFFEDTTAQLNWKEVQRLQNHLDWQNSQIQDEGLNFGFTKSAYWLRLNVENNSNKAIDKMLELSKARLNYVNFYQIDAIGQVKTYLTGDLLPFSSRPYPSRFFVLPVNIPAQSKVTFFIRVQSESSLVIPLKLWSPKRFYSSERINYAFQAMYLGLAIGMILLNLLIFISIKDYNYLLYAGLASSLVFSITALNGLQKEFLPFDSELYFRIASPTGFAIAQIFAVYFLRNMLKTWISIPKFDPWLKALALCHLCLPFAYLLSEHLFVIPGQILNFVTMTTIFVVASQAVLRKQREAYFFFIAFFIIILAGAVTAAVPLLIFPVSVFSLNALQIGSAIEMVLMSFAIADRFHILRVEMLSAQSKALSTQEKLVESLKKSEKILEDKVTQRTTELQSVNKDLQMTLLDLREVQKKLIESETKAKLGEEYAKKALDEQRQFIAMVSHEFRTPLAIIDSANQLLERKIQYKSDTASILARVRRAVSRLTNFLDNYLTQDRLASYELKLNYGDVSLRDLVSSVVDYARLISDQFSLVVDLDVNLVSFKADPDLLRILVFNLVSNAVKYSPAGQPVILRIYKQDQFFKIEVIDHGFGVSEQEIPYIFKIYARGKQASVVPGAGLGLSLVERITQLHGGTIEFKSTEGVGTHVIVSFLSG